MKKKWIFLFAALIAVGIVFFVVRWRKKSEKPVIGVKYKDLKKPVAMVAKKISPEDLPKFKKIAQCSNNFSFDLYAQLKDEQGNIFCSPYNISSALSMAYTGARGKTEEEMKSVLCRTLDQKALHSFCAGLRESLDKFVPVHAALQIEDQSMPYELNVANKLFIQKDYKILSSFSEVMTAHYEAAFDLLDFKHEKDKAILVINDWVSEKTKAKIKNIVSRDVINESTRLVIASAIYFRGRWTNVFSKKRTEKKTFHIDKTNKIDVDMMNQTKKFKYMEDKDLQMLELPYVGDRLSMVVLLPKEVDGLPAIEKKISNKMFEHCVSQLRAKEVIVQLPKFGMEKEYPLKDPLEKMGMATAFNDEADFSGISKKKDLFISAVIQKAFVKTDEDGSEAAAASVVVVAEKLSAEIGPKPEPVKFIADHPFLFFIRDHETDLILFMGRVSKPEWS